MLTTAHLSSANCILLHKQGSSRSPSLTVEAWWAAVLYSYQGCIDPWCSGIHLQGGGGTEKWNYLCKQSRHNCTFSVSIRHTRLVTLHAHISNRFDGYWLRICLPSLISPPCVGKSAVALVLSQYQYIMIRAKTSSYEVALKVHTGTRGHQGENNNKIHKNIIHIANWLYTETA